MIPRQSRKRSGVLRWACEVAFLEVARQNDRTQIEPVWASAAKGRRQQSFSAGRAGSDFETISVILGITPHLPSGNDRCRE
jgi:hypothetical protein